MKPNLILCGFKGSGKSTLGALIAEKLEMNFIDTDTLLLSSYAHSSETVSLLHKRVGEKQFRILEKQMIFSLHNRQNTVIATGGGVILDPENVAFLKKRGVVFFLKRDKNQLKKQLTTPPYPAFFEGDNETAFEKMYHKRLPLYEEAADFTVCTEQELWEAIYSVKFFGSSPGESHMEKQLEWSSMAVLPG